MSVLTIIPARMASQRLPGKPLADIHGLPMVVHVLQRAQAAQAGPVWVACAEAEIAEAVRSHGGDVVMTDPDLPSGTDRVRVAADMIDPDGNYKVVINVQGDMPSLAPELVEIVAARLTQCAQADIATLAVASTKPADRDDPNVVKAVIAASGQALYFTRAAAPSGEGPIFHHIGLYAYRRAALARFCALKPSPLEQRERLEQLRALEAGMYIDVALVEQAPHGVDTSQDLARARDILTGLNSDISDISV